MGILGENAKKTFLTKNFHTNLNTFAMVTCSDTYSLFCQKGLFRVWLPVWILAAILNFTGEKYGPK